MIHNNKLDILSTDHAILVDQPVKVKVYGIGIWKKLLGEAVGELLGFVENYPVTKTFILSFATVTSELETLAESKSIRISPTAMAQHRRSSWFGSVVRPREYTLAGGKFDIQSVEDYLRKNCLLL